MKVATLRIDHRSRVEVRSFLTIQRAVENTASMSAHNDRYGGKVYRSLTLTRVSDGSIMFFKSWKDPA